MKIKLTRQNHFGGHEEQPMIGEVIHWSHSMAEFKSNWFPVPAVLVKVGKDIHTVALEGFGFHYDVEVEK